MDGILGFTISVYYIRLIQLVNKLFGNLPPVYRLPLFRRSTTKCYGFSHRARLADEKTRS